MPAWIKWILVRFFGNVFSKPGFSYTVGLVTLKQRKKMPLEIKLTNEQQVTVRLQPVTPAGRPAVLDGKPEWKVVSGASIILPAEDGLSCLIVSSDLADATEISVSADADLGEGVETISDLILVNVEHAKAASLGLVADAPVLKP